MSNSLAIAAVTQTVRQILDGPVGLAVAGAHATILRPEEAGGAGKPGVNIFLYQVAPNPSWRNEDLPTRGGNGQDMLRRPRAAIDLHYLLTFYGSDIAFEPQRILGAVVRVLHADPILTRTSVRNAIAAAPQLTTADLADDVDVVRLTPLPLSLEELSKLWSVFFQTKYALSVAYQASVVLIEGSETTSPPLPVAARRVVVVPSIGPFIEKVSSQGAAAGAPIVSGVPVLLTDKLIIDGRGLRGPSTTQLRIGQGVFTPATVDSNRIIVDLNTELPAAERRAGVKLVQVVHEINFGTPADPHRGFESNAIPFMLSPTITVYAALTTHTQVVLNVSPDVAVGQRAVLLLTRTPAVTPAQAYAFPKIVDVAGASLTIPISGVVGGVDYLVRLQIDGAESPLDIETNPVNPNFGLYKDTPKVSLP